MDISIIIPVYNEEKNLVALYNQIVAVLKRIRTSYEIIFIDDGSRDKTVQVLRKMKQKDPNIKVIQHRKNFGKAVALQLGFNHCKGDFVFTMDGDLQDDPREFPRFLEKINKGYDLVSGWKFKRHDPLSKTIPSKFFNWLTAVVTGVKIHDSNCGFKCYRKEVVKNVEVYGELHRYIPALAHWKGYKVGEIKVRHHPRFRGKSKYGFSRLFKGFFDLMTVGFLGVYEKRPLHLFGVLGSMFLVIGVLLGAYIFYIKFVLLQQIGVGRPLVTLTALAVIAGIQLISMGLIGELIIRKFANEEKSENFNKRYVKKVY
ncbi:glycosyltransferase family 2 protein [Candidatus Woesearchaeota archaeon]|nr:glycosyltransferase family 2 protein [Candidatus Woesearchaeota archaeon]